MNEIVTWGMPVSDCSKRIKKSMFLGRVKFVIQVKGLNIPYVFYISANFTK
jgi:hypothetical protein